MPRDSLGHFEVASHDAVVRLERMSRSYTSEAYDLSDLSELSALYQLVMNRPGDEAYFNWKYLQNPAGRAVCAAIRSESGELATFYGMIPEIHRIGGRETVIYQGCDLMTHPDHRGQGLFPKGFEKCVKLAREQQPEFHFIGFGGPATLSGYRRLGLKFPVDVGQWVKPILPIPSRRVISQTSNHDEALAKVAELEGQLNNTDEVHSTYKVITHDLLKWRTRNPQRKYHVIAQHSGYAILSLTGDRAQLVHGRIANQASLPPLKREIIQWAQSVSARFLVSLASESGEFKELLTMMGFFQNPFKFGPLNESTPLMTYSVAQTSLDQAGSWTISPFYFDSY